MTTGPGEVRLGMCIECGAVFNLKSLEKVNTPAIVQRVRLADDPILCKNCQVFEDCWPRR